MSFSIALLNKADLFSKFQVGKLPANQALSDPVGARQEVVARSVHFFNCTVVHQLVALDPRVCTSTIGCPSAPVQVHPVAVLAPKALFVHPGIHWLLAAMMASMMAAKMASLMATMIAAFHKL